MSSSEGNLCLIDFAKGQPGNSLLPYSLIQSGSEECFKYYKDNYRELLNYGANHGSDDLRKNISKWITKENEKYLKQREKEREKERQNIINTLTENEIEQRKKEDERIRAAWTVRDKEILITNGNSFSLYFLCTQILKPGGLLITESATYFAGIEIFKSLNLEMVTVSVDIEGLSITHLEQILQEHQNKQSSSHHHHHQHGSHHGDHYQTHHHGNRNVALYTIPTYQNPLGFTMSLERRKKLIELSQQYGMYIFSDDAYQFLRWTDQKSYENSKEEEEKDKDNFMIVDLEEDQPPPLLYFLEKDYCATHEEAKPGYVFSLESFSKILAPGLRVGWIHCTEEIVTMLSTRGLLHSGGGLNPLNSHIISRLFETYSFHSNLKHLKLRYKILNQSLFDSLSLYFDVTLISKREDLECKVERRNRENLDSKLKCYVFNSGGGFFVWVYFPDLDHLKNISTSLISKICFEKMNMLILPGTLFLIDHDDDDDDDDDNDEKKSKVSIEKEEKEEKLRDVFFSRVSSCIRLTTVVVDSEKLIEEGINRLFKVIISQINK